MLGSYNIPIHTQCQLYHQKPITKKLDHHVPKNELFDTGKRERNVQTLEKFKPNNNV